MRGEVDTEKMQTYLSEEQISMQTLLEIFQICDSTFPIGTFNHSFGMENYLNRRVIRRAPEFRTWIKNYFRSQYRYGEGFLTILCYRAMDGSGTNDVISEEKDPDITGTQFRNRQNQEDVLRKILDYDDIITKSTLALETRDGTKMIARQMYLLIQKMYGDTIPYLSEYAEKVENEEAYGNPAIVFSMFAHEKNIAVKDAYEMYGYSVASTLVQNAVRSVPLGQRQGQVILKEVIELICTLYEKSEELPENCLGANAPGLELAQIAHETQPARLFMS